MTATTPDIAGFVAASRTLRAQTGDSVVFSIPQAPVWPVGTQINPDTDEPYSPMISRTNDPYTTVTITAGVILKEASPLRPQADAHFAAAGLLSGMDIILDIDANDYPTVQNASDFEYAGKNYRVEEFKPFQLGGQFYRYLIYGMER